MKLSCVLLCAIAALLIVQSQADSCTTTSANAVMTNNLIQTLNGLTTVSINVTNLTPQGVYYVQFSIDNEDKSQVLIAPVTSGTYTGHYTWTLSVQNTRGVSTPGLDWLRFSPTSGNTGVTCTKSVCVQTLMASGQTNAWQWDVFTFQVSNYNPLFPWRWQLVAGSVYSTFGPLDMSLCYCANCDAGFFQRDVLPCNLGYVDSTGAYSDASTTRSESVFNENEILYSYAISGDWVQMFYTDEHSMMLGIDSITLPNGTTVTYPILAPSPNANPTCVIDTTATVGSNIAFGSPVFDGLNPLANVDLCGTAFGCTPSSTLPCPRPMPPVLFLTDITDNPNSRAGDWQFGGKPYLPHKVCGLWKTATKTALSQNSDGTWAFTTNVGPDNGGNSQGTIGWNLGAGSDPLPFIPGFSKAVQGYGTEVAWSFTKLGLNPSRNYRFQFFVHDGDQSHNGLTGGDVGQGCIIATAACPAGFVGATCSQCDLRPAPYDGSYSWYCYPTLNATKPYNLVKIPTSKLTELPYLGSGGFVPGVNLTDGEGFNITCDCQRIVLTCPLSCCGQGICHSQTGKCICPTPPTGFTISATNCCLSAIPPPPPPPPPPPSPETLENPQPYVVPAPPAGPLPPPPPPPPPPCYNNGTFCSGHGVCNVATDKCVCAVTAGTNYTGVDCSNVVPVPPPTCSTLNASTCDNCFELGTALSLTCLWCTSTSNFATTLTNGSCVSAATSTCPTASTLTNCLVPAVSVPPACPDNCTFNGVCKNVTQAPAPTAGTGSAGSAATPAPASNTTNVTQQCVCFDHYSGINCGDYDFTSDAIIAASVSAGVIAAIVLGAALICGASGAGTYAAYTKMADGDIASTQNNPLYAGTSFAAQNPLHKGT